MNHFWSQGMARRILKYARASKGFKCAALVPTGLPFKSQHKWTKAKQRSVKGKRWRGHDCIPVVLLYVLLGTSATLLVTSALLVVTRSY